MKKILPSRRMKAESKEVSIWITFLLMVFLLSAFSVHAATYSRLVTQNMTTDSAPSPYVASGTSETLVTQQAWQAFDGKTQDVLSYFQANANTPQSVTLDLGAGNATVVSSFNYTTYNGIGTRDYDPQNMTFFGSNGGANTHICTFLGIGNWAQGETRQFNCTNSVAYRYYGLEINQTRGPATGAVLFPEFMLLRTIQLPLLTFNGTNLSDNISVSNFCVVGSGANTFVSCTTNGSVYYNNTGVYNFTGNSTGYLNVSISNFNFTGTQYIQFNFTSINNSANASGGGTTNSNVTVDFTISTLEFLFFIIFIFVGLLAIIKRIPAIAFFSGAYIMFYGLTLFKMIGFWIGLIVTFLGIAFIYLSFYISMNM